MKGSFILVLFFFLRNCCMWNKTLDFMAIFSYFIQGQSLCCFASSNNFFCPANHHRSPPWTLLVDESEDLMCTAESHYWIVFEEKSFLGWEMQHKTADNCFLGHDCCSARHLMHFLKGTQHDVAQQTSTGRSSLDVSPMPPLTIFPMSNWGKGFSSACKTLQHSQECAWDVHMCKQRVHKRTNMQPSGFGVTSVASSNWDIRI